MSAPSHCISGSRSCSTCWLKPISAAPFTRSRSTDRRSGARAGKQLASRCLRSSEISPHPLPPLPILGEGILMRSSSRPRPEVNQRREDVCLKALLPELGEGVGDEGVSLRHQPLGVGQGRDDVVHLFLRHL